MKRKDNQEKRDPVTITDITEVRCKRLEGLAARPDIDVEDRRALLDSAKMQRNWAASISEHHWGEQSRNMDMAGAMLQIIKMASESLAPWSNRERIDTWLGFKKIGGRK